MKKARPLSLAWQVFNFVRRSVSKNNSQPLKKDVRAAMAFGAWAGYPRAPSGPPRLDANNNVIPNTKTLCATEVRTSIGSFRDYVAVGNTASPVNPAELDVFGDAKIYGNLIVSASLSPSGTAALVVEGGATLSADADLELGVVNSQSGSGASIIFAKGGTAAPVNPSRGGRLDVIYHDPTDAGVGGGFANSSELPPYYLAGGTGIFHEEKYGPVALGLAGSSWGLLTTTVLSTQGAAVTQTFQSSNGLYGRTSNAPATKWGLWTPVAAFPPP